MSIINAGNVKCPYEPKNDVPKKQRVFFDEKGQALKGAPVPNMTMEGGEVHCKSYQKHPTPGLKTKGRGEITDKIGCIAPGLSLRFSIWDEAKERTRCVAVASGLQELVRGGCALPHCNPDVSCATFC